MKRELRIIFLGGAVLSMNWESALALSPRLMTLGCRTESAFRSNGSGLPVAATEELRPHRHFAGTPAGAAQGDLSSAPPASPAVTALNAGAGALPKLSLLTSIDTASLHPAPSIPQGGTHLGSFSAAGTMAVPRIGHTATLLANGRVLIAGGSDNTAVMSSAEYYDPKSGGFQATRVEMTEPREQHSATLLADGRVLIAGGFGDSFLRSAEIFNPASGNFTIIGNMTESRYAHVALTLADGRVLVMGGYDGAKTLRSAEIFDPVSGRQVYRNRRDERSPSPLYRHIAP